MRRRRVRGCDLVILRGRSFSRSLRWRGRRGIVLLWERRRRGRKIALSSEYSTS